MLWYSLFQTLHIYLNVFKSFKTKYFDTEEFSGEPLVLFIGFSTTTTKVSWDLLTFEEVGPILC